MNGRAPLMTPVSYPKSRPPMPLRHEGARRLCVRQWRRGTKGREEVPEDGEGGEGGARLVRRAGGKACAHLGVPLEKGLLRLREVRVHRLAFAPSFRASFLLRHAMLPTGLSCPDSDRSFFAFVSASPSVRRTAGSTGASSRSRIRLWLLCSGDEPHALLLAPRMRHGRELWCHRSFLSGSASRWGGGIFNVLGEVRICYRTCFQALLQDVLGHLPALWKMCPTHRCCLVGVRRSVLDAVGTGMPPLLRVRRRSPVVRRTSEPDL